MGDPDPNPRRDEEVPPSPGPPAVQQGRLLPHEGEVLPRETVVHDREAGGTLRPSNWTGRRRSWYRKPVEGDTRFGLVDSRTTPNLRSS